MSPFPISNDDLQTLAAGYVLGDLSSAEMIQFQQLLLVYPELTKMVDSLQATLSQLPQGLSQQQPNRQVKTNLLANAKAQLYNTTPCTHTRPPQSRFNKFWPNKRKLTPIVASAAILLGGSSLWLTHRVATLQAQLAMTEHFAEIAITQRPTAPPTPSPTPQPTQPLANPPLPNQQWPGPAQVMQDHLGSLVRSQGPVDVATTDPNVLLTQFLSFEKVPILTVPQAQLLGGSLCKFGKTQGMRVTYQFPHEHTLSVYQIHLNGDQFPTLPETYITLKEHNTNLILWRGETYLYALAAELPLSTLQTMAKSL